MNFQIGKVHWMLLLAILTAATVAYCATKNKADSELIGTVIDTSTGKPLEDAFVIAQYLDGGSFLGGHAASWCVKTKGMVTGKDGVYRFPFEDGRPPSVAAIKHDYALGAAGSDQHDIQLTPQDPSNPKFWNHIFCDRPQTKDQMVAAIEFEKLFQAELMKYFPERGRPREEYVKQLIHEWESLPEQQTPKK